MAARNHVSNNHFFFQFVLSRTFSSMHGPRKGSSNFSEQVLVKVSIGLCVLFLYYKKKQIYGILYEKRQFPKPFVSLLKILTHSVVQNEGVLEVQVPMPCQVGSLTIYLI
jgi:hypothetical protein